MVDIERTGNLIEAGFWTIFGMVLIIAACKQKQSFRLLGLAAGLISIVFGISDLVESQTGAWWRPWWLFVWKGVCLSAMALCVMIYWRMRCRPSASGESDTQAASSSI